MKEYIFFTTEGSTEAPNEAIVVDNCQVIGRANGNNEKEALRNLINDNAWILEAGFDTSKFIVEQIITDDFRQKMASFMSWALSNNKVACKNTDINEIIRQLSLDLTIS